MRCHCLRAKYYGWARWVWGPPGPGPGPSLLSSSSHCILSHMESGGLFAAGRAAPGPAWPAGRPPRTPLGLDPRPFAQVMQQQSCRGRRGNVGDPGVRRGHANAHANMLTLGSAMLAISLNHWPTFSRLQWGMPRIHTRAPSALNASARLGFGAMAIVILPR